MDLELHSFSNEAISSKEVMFALQNGLWINATTTAKEFGKRVDNYFTSKDTIEYMEELAKLNSLNRSDLKVAVMGRSNPLLGTWLREEICIHFLLWVGISYSEIIKNTWCTQNLIDLHIEVGGSTLRKNIVKKKSKGIYLLTDGRAYKIGIATNIKNRQKQIQTGNPFEIKVLLFVEVEKAKTLETFLHSRFDSKRLMGEWFDLTTEDVETVLEIMEEHRN